MKHRDMQRLVSQTYSKEKWDRALAACQEALTAADDAGYELFDLAAANAKAELDKVELPFIPGKEADEEENTEFKQRVRMFQYLSTANEGDGNKELIWGLRISQDGNNSGEATESRLPNKVVKRSNGGIYGRLASHAPTLYAAQHFYTETVNFRNWTIVSTIRMNGIHVIIPTSKAPSLQPTNWIKKM